MKLIKVEYLEESSEAIFFNITFKTSYSYFFADKELTKRAFIEKWSIFKNKGFSYANNFQWSDNTNNAHHQFDKAILQEMILAYENSKKSE